MTHQPTAAQAASLFCLRVTLGLLLVWWGLARALNPELGTAVSERFYLDLFSTGTIQLSFGIAQVLIGLAVIIGFQRRLTVLALFLITGVSSLSIWQALLDPFGFYLPFEKLFEFQHLFYPSAIIVAGAFVMMVFRSMDTWSVDRLLSK